MSPANPRLHLKAEKLCPQQEGIKTHLNPKFVSLHVSCDNFTWLVFERSKDASFNALHITKCESCSKKSFIFYNLWLYLQREISIVVIKYFQSALYLHFKMSFVTPAKKPYPKLFPAGVFVNKPHQLPELLDTAFISLYFFFF